MTTYKLYEANELLTLLSQDDKAAFTELYERFWKKLFVIALNRLKEKEAAEDIVHDIFASLWANRKQVVIDSAESYLAVSVKYAVLRKIKKKLREKEVLEKTPVPVAEFSAEISLHYKQFRERIKAEVELLPEKCRLIFKCSRDAGMPVKEIARELKLSPKTVTNQLTKAIRHLKLAARSFLHFILLFLFIG